MSKHYFTALQSIAVDRENSIIRCASLISTGDAKGHFDAKGRQIQVDDVTLEQIFRHCKKLGTVKLKADHGSGVFEIVGWADNFALTAEKVIADLHFYESEPQRMRLMEIAATNPHHMGISMEFTGADKPSGKVCLSRCDEVIAAAIVDDPAANSSLFSVPAVSDEQEPETNTTNMENETNEPTLTDLMAKFEELSTRLTALETPPAEPVATDPEKDPEGSDPAKTYENPDADKDDEATKKAELAAERIAEKFVAKFMGQVGMTKLSRPGGSPEPIKEKSFDELVKDESANHHGCEVKAYQALLARIGSDATVRKAYAASRNVKTA